MNGITGNVPNSQLTYRTVIILIYVLWIPQRNQKHRFFFAITKFSRASFCSVDPQYTLYCTLLSLQSLALYFDPQHPQCHKKSEEQVFVLWILNIPLTVYLIIIILPSSIFWSTTSTISQKIWRASFCSVDPQYTLTIPYYQYTI